MSEHVLPTGHSLPSHRRAGGRGCRGQGAGAAGWLAAGALFAAAFAPASVLAQETDDRWLAWMGCWRPVAETAPAADAPEALLCFGPRTGDAAVEMVSLEDGEVAARQALWADGRRHDAEVEGCAGWDRGDFSVRPGRVFLASEYECEGGTARAATGIMAMVAADEWVDIKVVDVEGEKLTWVTRYRLASPRAAEEVGFGDAATGRGLALRSARAAGAARPSVDDIIEATAHVDPEGVSAWLAERDARLDLESEELIRLADAGVPEEVIDMAIAVSYPSRFAVGREDARDAGYGRYGGYGGYGPWGWADPYYWSLYYSPFGYRYGRLGFGYGYGYGGFYVPIIRSGSRDSGGRVIAGQGYRRGSRGATSSRTPTSRGASVGRASGGSRGSTGRTARRRGGGGL